MSEHKAFYTVLNYVKNRKPNDKRSMVEKFLRTESVWLDATGNYYGVLTSSNENAYTPYIPLYVTPAPSYVGNPVEYHITINQTTTPENSLNFTQHEIFYELETDELQHFHRGHRYRINGMLRRILKFETSDERVKRFILGMDRKIFDITIVSNEGALITLRSSLFTELEYTTVNSVKFTFRT